MEYKNWRNAAELIGIAAIVASLVFVGLQMRQAQDIARTESILENTSMAIAHQIALAEYSDLFVKANSGNELSESERFQLRMIMEATEDRIFMLSLAVRPIGLDLSTGELKFASFLYDNPGAREVWLQMDDDMERYIDPLRTPESLARTKVSGSSAFRRRIKEHLSTLDELYSQ